MTTVAPIAPPAIGHRIAETTRGKKRAICILAAVTAASTGTLDAILVRWARGALVATTIGGKMHRAQAQNTIGRLDICALFHQAFYPSMLASRESSREFFLGILFVFFWFLGQIWAQMGPKII